MSSIQRVAKSGPSISLEDHEMPAKGGKEELSIQPRLKNTPIAIAMLQQERPTMECVCPPSTIPIETHLLSPAPSNVTYKLSAF